jgi:hypothetical protein
VRIATCWELIFELAAVHCCQGLTNVTLPFWHDKREKTFQVCEWQNNVNHSIPRSKMTYLASMVIKERQTEYWGRTGRSLHHGKDTTPTHHEVASFCCVLWMDLMNENAGELWWYFYIKRIKWVKSSFGFALFILRWEIFVHRDILEGHSVMLIK